jgi:hypothetical protein
VLKEFRKNVDGGKYSAVIVLTFSENHNFKNYLLRSDNKAKDLNTSRTILSHNT